MASTSVTNAIPGLIVNNPVLYHTGVTNLVVADKCATDHVLANTIVENPVLASTDSVTVNNTLSAPIHDLASVPVPCCFNIADAVLDTSMVKGIQTKNKGLAVLPAQGRPFGKAKAKIKGCVKQKKVTSSIVTDSPVMQAMQLRFKMRNTKKFQSNVKSGKKGKGRGKKTEKLNKFRFRR